MLIIFKTHSNHVDDSIIGYDYAVLSVSAELVSTLAKAAELVGTICEVFGSFYEFKVFDYRCEWFGSELEEYLDLSELDGPSYIVIDSLDLEGLESNSTECDSMVVGGDSTGAHVQWSAIPKHTEMEVITYQVKISELIELLQPT